MIDNIGELMLLPIEEVSLKKSIDIPSFLVIAAADVLSQVGFNSVPVIVKEISRDKYEVVGNSFVYVVSKKAKIQSIWSVILDKNAEGLGDLSMVLSGEETPKISLSKATSEEIKLALQYLIQKPGSTLKSVDLLVASDRISNAPDRKRWKNLDPITKLRCGITAAKVKALNEIFYLTPEEPESKSTDLQKMTVPQLKALAKERGIPGYSKKTKAVLIKELSGG